MNTIHRTAKLRWVATLIAGIIMLAGCSIKAIQSRNLAERDAEVRKAEAELGAAKNDAQRVAAYAHLGDAVGEKSRYARAMKLISSDEYVKLFDIAIQDHTQSIALDSGNANLYYRRGRTYYFRAALDMMYNTKATTYLVPARADFVKAVALNPKNAETLDMLGLTDASLSNWNDAVHDFEQEVALDPKTKFRLADAYCNRGLAYLQEKKFDLAEADLTQSINIRTYQPDPCECEPHGLLLAIYVNQTHEYDKARAVAAKARAAGIWVDPTYLEQLKAAKGN